MEFDHPDEPLDEKLDVLADVRRRTVLRFLREQPGTTASIDDLAEYVHSRELTPETERAARRERIEIELHHRHLPKLADQDLIEYDVRSGRIRYRPDETTEELLQFVRDV